MGYGGTTNPALLAAIRRAPQQIQPELLATTWAETGGRLDPVGDNGQSFGPYQEYSQGRGAGIAPAARRDPVASTQRATREFLQYKDKGLSGGALAAAAQRPADPVGYAHKVDSYIDDARRILGNSAPVGTASPATSQAQNESPTGPNGGAGLEQSIATSLASRHPGESLFHSVLNGVLATAVNTPAMSQRSGVTVNPNGGGPATGGSGEPGAVGAAKRWLGTPYVWGAGGPSGPTTAIGHGTKPLTGFDCSSLVQYAWSKMGVSLPRTTYDQIHVGQGINAANRNAWRPGDLLFPSTHHVQMYVGNGKVIEAPQTGGHVQIVPARSSYVAVRRPR